MRPTLILALALGALRLEAGDVSAARVETVLFKSPSIGRVLPCDVVLPPDYASSPAMMVRAQKMPRR